jgi:hypothetical protein
MRDGCDASHRYWGDLTSFDTALPLDELGTIASRVPSRFLTMDIAFVEKRGWTIVELGDGQVAGLPSSDLAARFFANIALAFANEVAPESPLPSDRARDWASTEAGVRKNDVASVTEDKSWMIYDAKPRAFDGSRRETPEESLLPRRPSPCRGKTRELDGECVHCSHSLVGNWYALVPFPPRG